MSKVCSNAYQQYCRSRPAASSDSNRRVKNLPFNTAGVNPLFQENSSELSRESLLDKMKSYRPQGTVFEICSKSKSNDYIVMKTKRALHKKQIESHHRKIEQLRSKTEEDEGEERVKLQESNMEDINETFQDVVVPKKRKMDKLYKTKAKKMKVEKDENYIPYTPADKHTEEG